MLSEEFLAKGIVKIPVGDTAALEKIKQVIDPRESWWESRTGTADSDVNPLITLNNVRLDIIKRMNKCSWFRSNYYSLAKSALHELVGNELVMQRNINLSIQLPGDDSGLLPIHADVLQGDSPFEVVLWVPLVDCHDTKSMFFARKNPVSLQGKTLEQLYAECDPYFVDCKYGECLIFSQNWFHGNVVNKTNETRWSLNCRFKSLFSPYADKKLGEFFEPIEIRPATRLGMDYERPRI